MRQTGYPHTSLPAQWGCLPTSIKQQNENVLLSWAQWGGEGS